VSEALITPDCAHAARLGAVDTCFYEGLMTAG
jgi:hypothetical protein